MRWHALKEQFDATAANGYLLLAIAAILFIEDDCKLILWDAQYAPVR